jgi:hypothetical protein
MLDLVCRSDRPSFDTCSISSIQVLRTSPLPPLVGLLPPLPPPFLLLEESRARWWDVSEEMSNSRGQCSCCADWRWYVGEPQPHSAGRRSPLPCALKRYSGQQGVIIYLRAPELVHARIFEHSVAVQSRDLNRASRHCLHVRAKWPLCTLLALLSPEPRTPRSTGRHAEQWEGQEGESEGQRRRGVRAITAACWVPQPEWEAP